ncbi:MAG: hypothetical protein H0U54_16070 [Acidobacteria bacterium]|jgi:hypothetical protein|nr:hypothetical protein [Acidobacteriota bacterium]
MGHDQGRSYTDLEIEGQEWEELIFKVLQAPEFQEYVEGENSNVYYKRQEKLLKEYLTGKGYPMIGSLWCSFIWWNDRDVNYLPSEVHQLLAECLKIQKNTENVYALSALEKLIAACNEALKINSGLCLLTD